MYPEILAWWSLFGRAEFQIPVVTGQLDREEEECRPQTIRDTSLSTVSIMTTNICIYRKEIQLFLPCGITCVPSCSGCLTISILKQNKRHLRMLISWTKKSPSIAQIYRIFVLIFPWCSFFFWYCFRFFSVCFLFCFKTTYLTTWASSGGQTNDAKKTHHFRSFSEIRAPAYETERSLSEESARFIAVIGKPL